MDQLLSLQKLKNIRQIIPTAANQTNTERETIHLNGQLYSRLTDQDSVEQDNNVPKWCKIGKFQENWQIGLFHIKIYENDKASPVSSWSNA